MRLLALTSNYALVLALVSCVEVPQRPQPRAGDPSITGLGYLLSDSDFRSGLALAHERLATLAPFSPIFRVVVVTPSRLDAYYCSPNEDRSVLGLLDVFFQNHPVRGFLRLQRSEGGWRILPGDDQRTLNDSEIMVVGQRSKPVWPNQAMKRIATG